MRCVASHLTVCWWLSIGGIFLLAARPLDAHAGRGHITAGAFICTRPPTPSNYFSRASRVAGCPHLLLTPSMLCFLLWKAAARRTWLFSEKATRWRQTIRDKMSARNIKRAPGDDLLITLCSAGDQKWIPRQWRKHASSWQWHSGVASYTTSSSCKVDFTGLGWYS